MAVKFCPLCKYESLAHLSSFLKAHLSECKNCGFVFSTFIPSGADLEKHYAHYDRTRFVSPITIERYKELLGEFSTFREKNRILDVGCGSGFFLETATALGWKAIGTEYGSDSVEFGRKKGLTIIAGALEDISLPVESFDVITSFEVIEHLSFPLPHLEKIYTLLRPGGLLYITTPNFGSLSRIVLGENWKVIGYPEHLSYFSAHSLDYALKKVGFEKKNLVADGINIDGLRNSLAKKKVVSENESPDSPRNKGKLSNEKVRQASRKYWAVRLLRRMADQCLNFTRTGEFLKGYYQKPL